MDKFPNAFRRYEEKENPKKKGIKTFPDLVRDYSFWQNYRASRKQVRAIAKLSQMKLGIKPIAPVRFRYRRTLKSGVKKDYNQVRWRDFGTGRFTGKPE